MTKVIIFSGLPGTGKSTLAEKLIKELKKRGKTKLLVSDEIRGKRYEKIFKWVAENLLKADFLVVDATFYKRKWRKKIKKIAGRKNVFTIFLDCSLQTSLKRNRQRKPAFSEKVIHIINAEMEKPKKPDILIKTDKVGPKEAVSLILKHLKT